MSRLHRFPLLATLGLGLALGFVVDRWLDVSTPIAQAQTRTSLADLQAQITALQTRVTDLEAGIQNLDASQITHGTLNTNRLPSDINAATLGEHPPGYFLTVAEAAAYYVPLSGGTMTGSLAVGGTVFGQSGVAVGAFAIPPGSPVVGQIVFNSTTGRLMYFDGAAWVSL